MSQKRVCVIEGEDASPEAVKPTVALIDRMDLDIEWNYPPVGSVGEKQYGSAFPDEARQAIDAADTTLFGATSGKTAMALFYLRWGKGTYANLRPSKWLPGYRSSLSDPSGVDLVIVRENLEDMYLMIEGELADLKDAPLFSPILQQHPAAMAPGRYGMKVITEKGTERIARFSFELARHRKVQGRPGRVTAACKYNMLPRSDGLFREITEKVAAEYDDVEYESMIVDNFAHNLCAAPHKLDVVLLPNLYGDILSDAAAGLIGGLGLAASGCYGDSYAYFESAHGTAPDIAGQNIINPTATLLSAAMMLDYLGFGDAAARLNAAIAAVYAEGCTLTPDQGGSASTTGFVAAVESNL